MARYDISNKTYEVVNDIVDIYYITYRKGDAHIERIGDIVELVIE